MTSTPTVTELRLVLTSDKYEELLALYRDQLGLTEVATYTERGGHVTILEAGRATLEINDPAYAAYIDEVEVGERVAGPIRLAVGVDDCDAATRRLTVHGVTVIAEPTLTPWGSRNARLAPVDGPQLTLFSGDEV